MKVRLTMLGLLLASVALADPQFPVINSSTPLSLDSLIALGFRYSPQLRQATLNTRLNAIGKLNAVGQFLPTVSLGMSFSQTHYRTPTFVNPNGSVSTYPVTIYERSIIWDSTGTNPRLSPLTPVVQDVPTGDSRASSQALTLSESIFEGGRRYFLYRVAHIQENINNTNVESAEKSLAAQIAE